MRFWIVFLQTLFSYDLSNEYDWTVDATVLFYCNLMNIKMSYDILPNTKLTTLINPPLEYCSFVGQDCAKSMEYGWFTPKTTNNANPMPQTNNNVLVTQPQSYLFGIFAGGHRELARRCLVSLASSIHRNRTYYYYNKRIIPCIWYGPWPCSKFRHVFTVGFQVT